MAPVTRRSPTAAGRQAGAFKTVQPARKTSGASSSRRNEARQLIESGRGRTTQPSHTSNDGMEIDNESSTVVSTQQIVHPLRDMAERIGREVELFAEKLDSWKPQKHQNVQVSQKAALNLVNDYRQIAEETVARLEKQHGAERRRVFAKKWGRARRHSEAVKHSSGNAEDEDSTEEDPPNPHAKTNIGDLVQWQEELHTWTLLQGLIACRYPNSVGMSADDEAQLLASEADDRFRADGHTWQEFLASSDAARESVVIVRWLQTTAEQTGDDVEVIEEALEKVSGRGKALFGSGWLDTRERLKGEKRIRLWDTPIDSGLPEIKNANGTEQLVTQLDLDAASRQNRTIEEPDRSFESSFWIMCWEMLRRGESMKKMHEWCCDRNEFARASSLGFHPPYESSISPHTRLQWRQACECLAQSGGLTAHERAVYALLSGNHESALKVCKEWSDFVYVTYNSIILNDYAKYILLDDAESSPQATPDDDFRKLPDLVSKARTTMASLQLAKSSRLDSKQPLKLIQAALICCDFQDFAMRQGVSLARQAGQTAKEAHLQLVLTRSSGIIPKSEVINRVTDDHNALRTLAHMIIVFQVLGQDFGTGEQRHAVENVICAYIDFLRLAGKYNLIPLYASMLSKARGILAMAHVLPAIVNPAERQEAMELMNVAGLDILKVLKIQYEYALSYSTLAEGPDKSFKGIQLLQPDAGDLWPRKRTVSFQPKALRLEEEVLIRSLEWFLLVKSHWGLSFYALTDSAKRFLESGRVTAALALFQRLPFADVSMVLTLTSIGKSVDIMDEHEGSDEEQPPPLRRSARNPPLFKAARGPRSVTPGRDKIKRDLLQNHARTYFELGQLMIAVECLWNWKATEDEYIAANISGKDTQTVRHKLREHIDDLDSAMEPLLRDFLQHVGPADTADQLRSIRHLYLPEVILAYISALYFAGHMHAREHLITIMDLATEIADNEDLIDCFKATGRMVELVDVFALASKAMLALNEEQLGTGGPSGGARKRTKTAKAGKKLAMWEISRG